jgi:hypothetical protein
LRIKHLLFLGKNCDKFGIVVHELGHVVGFYDKSALAHAQKHLFFQEKNCDNFGIVVNKLGYVVGF